MQLRTRTEYFAARVYPESVVRIREIRDRLATMYPDRHVTMADVFSLAVGSATAAIDGKLPLPIQPQPKP